MIGTTKAGHTLKLVRSDWVIAMRRLLLLALLGMVSLAASPVLAAEIQKCSMVVNGESTVLTFDGQAADGHAVTVEGILTKPDGDGPFPLVVMLPGDGGLVTPYCNGIWARKFASWGYASVVVAVTTGRNDSGERRVHYTFLDVVEYARFVAADLLGSPDIDGNRIGLWGFSRGGLSALEIATGTGFPGGAFKAVVALAPHCPSRSKPPQIPVVIMHGTADAVIPVDVCTRYADRMTGSPGFEFITLNGAQHVFWLEEPHATTSTSKIMSFLSKHL